MTSLKGEDATITGRVRIGNEHVNQTECMRRAKTKGAHRAATDISSSTTLLIWGGLPVNVVSDPDREYSRKLIKADDRRRDGDHVHVVDEAGFASLLRRQPAHCLRLTKARRTVVVERPEGQGILGGPLKIRKPTTREGNALTVDLSKLDAATEAHEKTLRALERHLHGHDIRVHAPLNTAPRFDVGWANGSRVFVGEVKSLSATDQDQQIRLGIGQLLDYQQQLLPQKVTPVLILERKPRDQRWRDLCHRLRIVVTYAPKFPDV
ncbi:hypothetical protein OG921_04510 [Aldersonia sp. NBC_00410]|uniref:hypothetical protein n=1 Tax=Aldersonia sp. NBC_00410 TaxID=2975954 RepID=UPI00225AD5ED|nr:hypothetical protein [Aldersonia sp. NBC_00410]MCX5042438.1 hypothetical protein [Aldersonia sp. NBC_00410]